MKANKTDKLLEMVKNPYQYIRLFEKGVFPMSPGETFVHCGYDTRGDRTPRYFECRPICGHFEATKGYCRAEPEHKGKHLYLMDAETEDNNERAKFLRAQRKQGKRLKRWRGRRCT